MRIRRHCPACFSRIELRGIESASGACPKCDLAWQFVAGPGRGEPEQVERCGFCGGRAFFVQRDFDQRIGCAIMAASIGAALFVGWRFGWIWFTPVLLATVLIDWVLAFKIKPVTICYRCDTEYRESVLNPRHRPYDPHIAERYAERKTVRRMVEN
jgi:hypothetical protein